ncbi:MAG: ribonuclease HII [Betaproteobacteria bacterium]|nr:ribonuclease HII [Betaproteobacteria bacterium]
MRRVLVAGVDEAGRGPLAGPVYAACVVLNPRRGIDGLADSKVLSPRRREELAGRIRAEALAWAVEAADVDEIDSLNILWATMAAMKRAVDRLGMVPDEVLVDGNRLPPELAVPARAIVRGDATVPAISAASILAKVARDAHMIALHEAFPHYGFDRHKGYPTAEHFAALERHGPCPHHRRTFSPVRACEADDEPGRAARPEFF